MDKYYFLYKSMLGWSACTNPVFIAEHQHCRAIPKNTVNNILGYDLINDLTYAINNNEVSTETLETLKEFNIYI